MLGRLDEGALGFVCTFAVLQGVDQAAQGVVLELDAGAVAAGIDKNAFGLLPFAAVGVVDFPLQVAVFVTGRLNDVPIKGVIGIAGVRACGVGLLGQIPIPRCIFIRCQGVAANF